MTSYTTELPHSSGDPSLSTNLTFSYFGTPDAKQARLLGRYALKPDIDLSKFRCEAVVDYVKIVFISGISTQFRHVQKALAEIMPLPRGHHHWVETLNGTAASATKFIVTIQDPDISQVCAIDEFLQRRFKTIGAAEIAELEVSIDFYPESKLDEDRAKVVGIIQRCYFAKFNVFTDRKKRPRVIAGSPGECEVNFLYPWFEDEGDGNFQSDAWSNPKYARTPFNDKILYFGSKDGDELVRIQNKVANNRSNDSAEPLSQNEKRARIEIRLRDEELKGCGIRNIADLANFNFAKLQKSYFHFALPTFVDETRCRLPAAVQSRINGLSIEHFLQTGIAGLAYVEKGKTAWRRQHTKVMKAKMRLLGKSKKRIRAGAGLHGNATAYGELNEKANEALRNLSDRYRRRAD